MTCTKLKINPFINCTASKHFPFLNHWVMNCFSSAYCPPHYNEILLWAAVCVSWWWEVNADDVFKRYIWFLLDHFGARQEEIKDSRPLVTISPQVLVKESDWYQTIALMLVVTIIKSRFEGLDRYWAAVCNQQCATLCPCGWHWCYISSCVFPCSPLWSHHFV